MPMHITSRQLARASAATLVALAVAACSDATSPNTVPNGAQATQTASFIADEILNSFDGLTADAAMAAPTASVANRSVAPFRVSAKAAAAECGAYTPALPEDTDGDGVYDDVTVSFTLPECHFADAGTGNTVDVTGSMHLHDDTPSAAGLSFSLGLTNLKVSLTDADQRTFTVTRNGTGSVGQSSSVLSQAHDFVTSIAAMGMTAQLTTNWNTTFTAAEGTSITAGQPLPDGTFAPGGTTEWRQGPNHFSFTLSAPTPLTYSAACASAGTYDNPFTGGVLRVDVTGSEGSGYVEIVYSDCQVPAITYFGTNAS